MFSLCLDERSVIWTYMFCSCFSIFLSYLSWSFASIAAMCLFMAFKSVWNMSNSEWILSRSYFFRWVNYSSSCSKIWLYREILSWDFLSNWSAGYVCSEVRVSTSFWMSTDEIYSWLIMVFFLELYQLFFLFFKTLIGWRNMSLEFFSKYI